MTSYDRLPENDQFSRYIWEYILPGGYAYESTLAIDGGPQVEDVTAERIATVHAFYAAPQEGAGWAETDVALLAELTDGTWATCVAWRDSSGWDCRSGANWRVAPTRELAISQGLDKAARAFLGLALPGEATS